MIELKLQGRMGNQLFQYACARSYQIKFNEEKLCIRYTKDKDELHNFNVSNFEVINKTKISIIQKIIYFIFASTKRIYSNNDNIKQQKYEKKWQPLLNKFGIYYYTQGYYDFKDSKAKVKLFVGYFESEKYFKDYKEIIQKELTLKNKIKTCNFEQQIKENTNSVAISIRRGDFVNLGNAICDMNYFTKAIKEMEKRINNPVFFVFSDDIDWAKEKIKFNSTAFYEEKGFTPIQTLKYMSECNNFIISNSTFHWWGQYFSKNNKKIVIAPKHWRKINIKLDIQMKNWIFINNE